MRNKKRGRYLKRNYRKPMKNCLFYLVTLLSIFVFLSCMKTPAAMRVDFSPNLLQLKKRSSTAALIPGKQIGDEIFLRTSNAQWILPLADLASLEQIQKNEKLSNPEYQARLNQLDILHGKYFIFQLELKMPFYSGWTQRQLQDFLEDNLHITIHSNKQKYFFAERISFKQVRRTTSKKGNITNLSVALRVYFLRKDSSNDLITDSTSTLTMKLRLAQQLPVQTGFFDEQFFQGFVWKIK